MRHSCHLTWTIACSLLLAGCDFKPPAPANPVAPPESEATVERVQTTERPHSARQIKSPPTTANLSNPPHFVDVADRTGLRFRYDNGAAGQVLMVESIGGGVGCFDFDQDGLIDIYLCQGGNPVATPGESRPTDELFRQVSLGQFEPVARGAAIDEQGYSMGVAAGDYDGDGFDDVYISNVGADTLLQNAGDGTFRDVTATAGVSNPLWSSSAAWGDLDHDGDLDLYVCNYVEYDPYHPIPCPREDGRPGTCHPHNVPPVPDECYFNQGNGTFTAEARARGLFGDGNKALGVVIADLNNDGLKDVYIANDTTPNFLFINQGSGRFEEMAGVLGCAVSREGLSQASMGVALGDYDRNGWLDLYCTHFTFESNTLYRNLGAPGFQDVTGIVGLHKPTYMKLGFGTVMLDFNQDGRDELFIANGHIDDWRYKGEEREMVAQLFSYAGPRFIECGAQAGDYFSRKLIGRGVAQCDYDNDGDWDLVVVHQDAPVSLLENDSPRGHWLKLRFVGTSNRRGMGARVVLRQGEQELLQELAGGTSFCASYEPALIFGLGEENTPCELDVLWPDGKRQVLTDVAVDQILSLREPK